MRRESSLAPPILEIKWKTTTKLWKCDRPAHRTACRGRPMEHGIACPRPGGEPLYKMAALSVATRRLPGMTQRSVLPIASVPCGDKTAHRTAAPRDAPGSRLLSMCPGVETQLCPIVPSGQRILHSLNICPLFQHHIIRTLNYRGRGRERSGCHNAF
jgi:hypothetical protein